MALILPCIPLNGFGASSSGYFLNFGVGLMVFETMFSWVTCLRVPIQGALPYKSSSKILISWCRHNPNTHTKIFYFYENRILFYPHWNHFALPSESSFFCRLFFWFTCRRLPAHGVWPASSPITIRSNFIYKPKRCQGVSS